jgi:hypothetical protein
MTITRILADGAKSLWVGYKTISVSSQYISDRATVSHVNELREMKSEDEKPRGSAPISSVELFPSDPLEQPLAETSRLYVLGKATVF